MPIGRFAQSKSLKAHPSTADLNNALTSQKSMWETPAISPHFYPLHASAFSWLSGRGGVIDCLLGIVRNTQPLSWLPRCTPLEVCHVCKSYLSCLLSDGRRLRSAEPTQTPCFTIENTEAQRGNRTCLDLPGGRNSELRSRCPIPPAQNNLPLLRHPSQVST